LAADINEEWKIWFYIVMNGSKYDKKNVVLFCALLINLQLGMSYSWSVFSKALIESYGWVYANAVLPSTLTTISYSVSMLVFGLFQEKFGPRKTLCIGALLMGGGLILCGITMSVPGIVLGYGICHGAGVGASFSTTQSTVLKWSARGKQGTISGLISSAYGLSSVIMSFLAGKLIEAYGIPTAFFTLAVVILLMILTAGSFVHLPQQSVPCIDTLGNKQASRVIMKEGEAWISETKELNFRQMIKTKLFYCLLGTYLFGAAAAMMPLNHISMIASIQGNVKNSYVFVSIISLFNCLGRLGGGMLGDMLTERKALGLMAVVNALNMFLFCNYTSGGSLILGCLLDGCHYGMIMALTPVLVSKLFGKKYCAQNYGAVACFGMLTGLLGTQLTGFIVDAFGSYQYAYLLCAGYLMISALFALKLPKLDGGSNR